MKSICKRHCICRKYHQGGERSSKQRIKGSTIYWSLLECSKTKDHDQFNATSESSVHALHGSEIEKVEDFLYLEGYMNSAHNVDTRIAKAWGALNAL